MDDAARAKQLLKAEQAYEAADEKADESKQARNQAVFDAIAARWSYTEISEAMGISRQRVAQIALLDPDYRPRRRSSE